MAPKIAHKINKGATTTETKPEGKMAPKIAQKSL